MVPQKRCIVSKALLSISFEGAIIFIFYAENVSFNEFTNSHRTRSKFLVEKTLFHPSQKRHICILVDRGVRASELENTERIKWKRPSRPN